MKRKIIVASNNKGKIEEIKAILTDGFEVLSLRDAGIDIDPEETGTTFFENALIKAKAVYEVCGCWTLSDDSGLCVDSLNGAPGVYSARFSGSDKSDKANNDLLLKKLIEFKDREKRTARFASSVVLYMGDKFIDGYGEVEGEILFKEMGENGFGYDPLFYSYELKKSFAEATAQEKNSISHRARALENLAKKMKADSNLKQI